MRIAYVITRADDLGGSQLHVRDMSAALQRRGHRVVVIAGRQGVLADQLCDRAVPYVEIEALARGLDPLEDVRGLGELCSALRGFRPDLVSAHGAKAGFLARLAAKSLGVPALFTVHGWDFSEGAPPPGRALDGWMKRSVALLSHRVIAVCDADRRAALREGVAPQQLRLVHHGVSDVEPVLRARPGSAPVRLITVSRLAAEKDQVTLFHALARLRDLPWHLDHVGDGPLRNAVHALGTQLHLRDRVTFLDLDTDIASLLARSQIYLLLSNTESFPHSILEAMRANLPVVASDVGGIRESVLDGTTGFVVAPSDAHALADRLLRLIASPSLRARMGTAGRARYEQQFTFERMLHATCEVYREIVGGTRRASSRIAGLPAQIRDRARRQPDPTAGSRASRVLEMKLDTEGRRALPVRWVPRPGLAGPLDRRAPDLISGAPLDEITLRGLHAVGVKHWRLIFAALLLTILGSAFVTLRVLTPLYESTAVVLIKPGREFLSGEPGERGVVPNRMDGIVMAEQEILRSEDLLRDAVSSLGPTRLYPDPEIEGSVDPLAAATRKYRENLWVTVVPGSQAIRIAFRHPDAGTAAASVNLLVDRFTEHHLQAFSGQQSRGFLEGKVTEDRIQLEDAEENLRRFQEKHPIVITGSPGQELEEQRVGLDASLERVRSDLTGLSQRLVYLKQHDASLVRTSELRQNLEQQIVSTAAELPVLKAREEGLEGQLATLEGKRQGLATLLKTYRDLLRERDAAERRHQSSSERLEETLVSEAMDQAKIANISLIQHGQVAQGPITPRKALNLAIGALLGLGLGFGSALLLEGRRSNEAAIYGGAEQRDAFAACGGRR